MCIDTRKYKYYKTTIKKNFYYHCDGQETIVFTSYNQLYNALVVLCESQFYKYSQTCIKRSHLGQRESGLIRQVTSLKRFNSYEIFYDRTRKGWIFDTGDCLIEVTAWTGLTVYITYRPFIWYHGYPCRRTCSRESDEMFTSNVTGKQRRSDL